MPGDAGFIDEDGDLHVMTRIDDIINVSGVRLSTGAIEEIIASHPAVAECAVIGPDDEFRGQVPVGLIVLKARILFMVIGHVVTADSICSVWCKGNSGEDL